MMTALSPGVLPVRHQARVVSIDDVLHDTRILRVRPAHGIKILYHPGQYAQLHLMGEEPRPFSIASSPLEDVLEFHVRNTGQGLSRKLAEDLLPGNEIGIEAPFGKAFWRKGQRPLLLLAGGLGIAPQKSIVETVLAEKGAPPLHLYWGVRFEEQLYLDKIFHSLVKKNKNFIYMPVISEGKSSLRKGLLPQTLKEDFSDLSGFDIYMAGPPAMMNVLQNQLLDLGAPENAIFQDNPDTPVRP